MGISTLLPTVGAALVTLSDCTMIPKYSRPDAPLPALFVDPFGDGTNWVANTAESSSQLSMT
jgi:hypothetical protein